MNTHCIVVESLDTGAVWVERVERDDPSHQSHAETLVVFMNLMPDERWRWGLIEIANPGQARLAVADNARVLWHDEVFVQRIEDDGDS